VSDDNVYELPTHELGHHYAVRDEQMMLGACLQDPEVAAECVALVPPDDLHVRHHRALLRLIGQRLMAGQPIDIHGVCVDIHQEGTAETYGGTSYVASLPEYAPSSRIDIVDLAARIRSRAVARVLVEVAESLAKAGAGQRAELGGVKLPTTPEGAAAVASEYLSQLGRPRVRTEWTLPQAIELARTERRVARGGRGAPVSTGIADLDTLLEGGLRPGQLVVVGGRPGSGKTALGLGMATSAVEACRRVCVVSLEMGAGELADRVISRIGDIPLSEVRTGGMDDGDTAFAEQLGLLIGAPASITPAELAACARRWSARGMELLIIDYLQLVHHDEVHRGRPDLAVGRTATLCKELARALQVPVVLLSQLSREVAKRGGAAGPKGDVYRESWWEGCPLPQDTDLRDSGQIEQDADIILFPVRATQYGLPYEDWAAVKVAKHRNGRTGTIGARWDGPTASYHQLEDER